AVKQAASHPGRTAFLYPGRQSRGQTGGTRSVWIHIGRHAKAEVLRAVDLADDGIQLGPVCFKINLEVIDFRGNIGLMCDAYRFIQGLQYFLALTSYMGDVHSAVVRR